MSATPAPFSEHMRELVAGGPPELPVAWAEWERLAYERCSADARAFVEGGAGTGATMRANREAFERRRIVPRVLRDVSARSHARDVLGMRLAAPIMLAPIGAQSLMLDGAELASARAAAELGLAFAVSTPSSCTLEEVAEAVRPLAPAPKLFQLYWPDDDRELAASLVARAEAAGYDVLVVTVDMGNAPWRPADLARAFVPWTRGLGIANLAADPVFRGRLARPPEEDPEAALPAFLRAFSNPGLHWEDLAWMRETTSLPIVLKGIQHPDDARMAVEAGVDGIVVSNHGGRQVDGAIGSLDALPAVVEAVGGRVEVLFDSGVRSGSDVLKALALGARAVLVGRPYLWGLALAGEDGVRAVLRALLAELDATLGLAGYASVDELSPAALAPLA
ncbi:MAG TPA: alpha-hydroxy-acid oxidizing protein [Solirubrobacteraceae bacterium]|nr:alpha-hydroxy-acid oxidizing protein [Solirubrobacteraceae bacterium]